MGYLWRDPDLLSFLNYQESELWPFDPICPGRPNNCKILWNIGSCTIWPHFRRESESELVKSNNLYNSMKDQGNYSQLKNLLFTGFKSRFQKWGPTPKMAHFWCDTHQAKRKFQNIFRGPKVFKLLWHPNPNHHDLLLWFAWATLLSKINICT